MPVPSKKVQWSAEERESIREKEMEILKTVSEKDTEIRSQETETVQMVDKKDSEKRQFNWGIVKVASSVLVAGLVIGVSVLGGNVNIKLPKKIWGCGRFLGPELSNSKTASILHRTQTP